MLTDHAGRKQLRAGAVILETGIVGLTLNGLEPMGGNPREKPRGPAQKMFTVAAMRSGAGGQPCLAPQQVWGGEVNRTPSP